MFMPVHGMFGNTILPFAPPYSSTHRFGRVKSTPVINYQLVSRFALPVENQPCLCETHKPHAQALDTV